MKEDLKLLSELTVCLSYWQRKLKPEEKIHFDLYPPALILSVLQKADISSERINRFLPDESCILQCREIPREIISRLNLPLSRHAPGSVPDLSFKGQQPSPTAKAQQLSLHGR